VSTTSSFPAFLFSGRDHWPPPPWLTETSSQAQFCDAVSWCLCSDWAWLATSCVVIELG
jgi:hypothetical protein